MPQGSPLSPLLANILLDELDEELEVRGHKFVRYWKQWGRPRTRRRRLLKPGIGRKEVHKASRSRKGHWRMSHNSLVKRAMNNEWLAQQGVPSLEHQWVSIRYPNGPKKSRSPV